MALTKVSPSLFQVSNNITSVTVGGSANTISLTFDSNGVITGASNNAVSVANTAITGNIISSQIASVNGSVITANTIANSAFQTGAVENYLNSLNSSLTGRNKIINGAMQVSQRNTSFTSVSTDAVYTLDRWAYAMNGGGAITAAQSSTAPTGFTNSISTTVTTSDGTVSSGSYYQLRQAIEGLNCADLGWGASGAKTVTVSFWVRSSVTGTYTFTLRSNLGTDSYVATYTIVAANTWEYKTITVPGPTSGTWLTTNGIGIFATWDFGTGSTAVTSSTNTWISGNYTGATGATKLINTDGATFYLTGVQLEKGSTPTPFEHRQYGTELQLCQRYYEKYSSSSETFGLPTAFAYNGAAIYGRQFYQVEKRAAPTITFSSTGNTLLECYATGAGSGHSYSGTIGAEIVNTKSFAWNQPVSGISGGVAIMAGIRSGQSFQISAEL